MLTNVLRVIEEYILGCLIAASFIKHNLPHNYSVRFIRLVFFINRNSN